MKKAFIWITLTVLTVSLCWAYDLNDIQSIEISAISGGWGELKPGLINKLTIKQINGQFVMENTAKTASDTIRNFIGNLLEVLNAPMMDNVDLPNLGVNNYWLISNGATMINQYHKWDKNQKDLIMKNYGDIGFIKKILQEQYVPERTHWTDDYPGFWLTINYTDSMVTISSDSQLPFMLPIKIKGNTINGATYNARLSLAISNLLPDNFVIKDRINGAGLPKYIYERVTFLLRDELSMLNSKNKIGDTLSVIEKNFIVKSSEITTIGSIDLHFENVWNSTLIPKQYPSNLVVGLSISYKDDRLGSMEQFYSKIDTILRFILDIPWLANVLKNEKNEVEIRFVNGKSMSDYAQGSFIKDLQNNHKNSILQEINGKLDDSIFITISNNRNYMRCIVLLNTDTVLWHYKGKGILLWDEGAFDVWDYYGHKGVGIIILKDGKIK
jgi:hypothetical protein